MQTLYTDALPFAPRPSLDQYKTLAKDLVKAARAGNVADVHAWASDWMERLTRLHGRTESADDIVRHLQTSRLLASDTRPATPTLAEAQLVVARLHGFESWPKFAKHLTARDDAGSPVSQFESAADAIVSGDVAGLRTFVARNPRVVNERSTRDHQATLLHYIAANGHEGFRQRTPKNAVEIARILLEAGAEPDALANMYNHRCTTMEMLVSSVHPHNAGVQASLVETLVDFGAAVDGIDNDGSPIMTAFRFHYPEAAAALVQRGAKIDNVVSAAAVGRADLIEAFVDDRGMLRPGVPLADVKWPRLPKDPAVHLGYALAWGCSFGTFESVELLLRKGVDPAGRDDDGTALHTAAGHGRMDLVRLLLKYGASLEALNSYGGTVLGATLWYANNAPIEGVDYAAVVRELLELGARTDAYPELLENVNGLLARSV